MTGSSAEISADDLWFHLALERLFTIAQSVTASAGFAEMANRIAEGLLGLGGAESVNIFLFDPDRAHVQLISAADSPGWIRDEDRRQRRLLSDWPSLEDAISSGAVVNWLVADANISDSERARYQQNGIAAILMLPLTFADDRLGFVTLEKRLPEAFTRRDIDLANMVAAALTLVFVSERALEQAASQTRDQQSLARIAQAAITQRGPRDMLQRVADVLRDLLAVDCVDIELWSIAENRGDIMAQSVADDWEAPLGDAASYPLSEWPTNLRMLREHRAVVVDIDDDLAPGEREYLAFRHVRQMHEIPLMYDDKYLGAIVFYLREPRVFDARTSELIDDAAAIIALAARAALALRSTQLERRSQEWQLRVNDAVLNDAPLSVVLDEAVAALCDISSAPGCMLSITDELTGIRFRRNSTSERFQETLAVQLEPERWPMTIDACANQRLRITAPVEDMILPADLDRLRPAGFVHLMAAPIYLNGTSYGAAVFLLTEELPPSEEILDFIRSMTRQIAIVVRDRSTRLQQDRSGRYLAAVLDVTQAAIAGSDLTQLLKHIAHGCLSFDDVDGCEIELYDPAAHTLTNTVFMSHRQWGVPFEPGVSFDVSEWPNTEKVVTQRKVGAHLISDPALTTLEREVYGRVGIGSLAFVPLLMADEVLGVMTLFREEQLPFSPQTMEFSQEIAAQASQALQRSRLFSALQERAQKDGLTGLLNHRAIMEQIDATLERAQETSLPVSLLLIDLDGFKLFNDLHGHLAGDRYLERIARVIEETIPLFGIAARYGGDEFLVLLPDVDQDGAGTIGQALLERVQTSNHLVDDIPVPLRCSIGSATAPLHATTRDKLIKHADLAMYGAKAHGGGALGQLPPAS
jgi:diguanylate cyclase (GGDEF)-like protein